MRSLRRAMLASSSSARRVSEARIFMPSAARAATDGLAGFVDDLDEGMDGGTRLPERWPVAHWIASDLIPLPPTYFPTNLTFPNKNLRVPTATSKSMRFPIDHFYKKLHRALFSGQRGFQEGRAQGRAQGREQALGLLARMVARKLRPLTERERATLVRRLDTLGPDRLRDVLLDLDTPALATWLANPRAR